MTDSNSSTAPSILLGDFARTRATLVHSSFSGSNQDIRYLVRFMEVNGWFGLEHESHGSQTTIQVPPKDFQSLDLWLQGYGCTTQEKYDLLIASYIEKHASLVQAWEEFRKKETGLSISSCLDILDFLLYAAEHNSLQWSGTDFEYLVSNGVTFLRRGQADYFLRFCMQQKQANSDKADAFRYSYRIAPSSRKSPTNALSLSDYASLAWLVFSDDAIQAGDYITKAILGRLNAEIWFLVAMHFVSALRIPDIQRLPVPHLPCPGSELRERIKNGNFSIGERNDLVNEWIFRIEMEGKKPHKTQRFKDVGRIMVCIPSSLFTVFGTILALVASYHEDGELLCQSYYVTGRSLISFFGKDFHTICGGQYFLGSRQLNKAFLQGVETIAEQDGKIHVRGYLLASILRGHKLPGGESLTNTTDAYLNDGDFSGISPQVVANEMFERGVFGFIPVILLSAYDNNWHYLNLHDQTRVIQALSLSAVQLERLAEELQRARNRMLGILSESLKNRTSACESEETRNPASIQNLMNIMLQQIAKGAAPGKNPCNMCLRSAVGLPCSDPDRTSCLGCGFELWTHAGVHLLMEEHSRNRKARQNASPVEAVRLDKILQTCIVPALHGILLSLYTVYNGKEAARGLKEMIERRIECAQS